MNIAFTGTTNHAAIYTIEIKDDGSVDFINTLTCTLDDKGKKNLTELKPTLTEYKNSQITENSIVITAKSKLSDADTRELNNSFKNNNFKAFLKKYNPHGDSITINGKEVIQNKNRIYIFKKLQELAKDILNIKDVYLLIPENLDKKRIIKNLGDDLYETEKQLSEALTVGNIKTNADLIDRSLANICRRIK